MHHNIPILTLLTLPIGADDFVLEECSDIFGLLKSPGYNQSPVFAWNQTKETQCENMWRMFLRCAQRGQTATCAGPSNVVNSELFKETAFECLSIS